MKPIRALVLDDSTICRIRLKDILEVDRDIKVVGEAGNGDRVLELIERTSPNVLLVDLEMPGTAGHATIERVMANRPLPILVVTGLPEGARKAEVFESIRRGALELAAKPIAGDFAAERRLRAQVRQLSTVPVVRHIAGKLTRPSSIKQLKPPTIEPDTGQVAPPLIAVGASAGGPMAMATTLAALDPKFGGAVAVVQHLPKGFAKAFVEFLAGRVHMPVRMVDGPVHFESGCIYVAPDDQHLAMVSSRTLNVVTDAPVEGHRPAVDVLFHSVSRFAGFRAAGVIMSGMGTDGVNGLKAMRLSGALTVAQDQATSGVFGMPGAAIERGSAQQSHPPLEIAAVVTNWTHSLLARAPR